MLSGCGGGGSDAPSPQPVVTNFAPAAVVIGQVTFSGYSSVLTGRTKTAATIDRTYGSVAINGNTLYVPDFLGNRVLGYNTIPTTNGAAADFVLGQPDLTSSVEGTSATTFLNPQSVRIAGGKLFMVDYANNRILIWNTPPTSSNVPADIVVGQGSMTTGDCTLTQSGLCQPEDVFVSNGKLIVSDSGNNRVLIWNSIPTTNGMAADVVLGQNSFTTNSMNDDDQDTNPDSAPSARTLSYPAGVWSNGTKLVVCDTSNNRVLVWNTIPTSNFTPASIVLGQNSFTMSTAIDDDQDGLPDAQASARTFDYPYFVTSNGVMLFVTDSSNSRVLVWETFPAANFAAATKVLGQNSLTGYVANDDDQNESQDAAPSARTLDRPTGLHLEGTTLYVGDNMNSRILMYRF